MSVGTAAAIAIGVSAAAGVGTAALGAHEADKAATTQADASKSAAELQKEESDKALAFQQQEYNDQKANQAPFVAAGTKAVNNLSTLVSTPGQGLLTPWDQQFVAPTEAQAEQEPGYKFALDQGTQALDESAAARGDLFSGTEGTALQQYGQGLGQQNYQNVYNRALGQYQQSYNIFNNNQATEYNRLAGLAGTGQTAVSQLGQEGQAAASNTGNIELTTGAQQGQDLTNAAAARASGYVGGANAIASGVNGIASAATLPLYMQMLKQQTPTDFSNATFG